ncbi:MAG: hypothetical protein FWD83_10460, partial [Promicromonosporaceae bacterium]|nr:hypothetical protein [Promicromonosporaceae bacterium]
DPEPPAPAPEPPAPVEVPTYAWTTYVYNSDGQGAIDQCGGGLTHWSEGSNVMGRPYYAIHNHCGGVPILSLQTGDRVLIQNVGVFEVVDARDVQQGQDTSALAGIGGAILLQTCYSSGNAMRVVGLTRI